MAFYKINDTTLTDIANAIRTKTGGSSTIRVDKMASAIESLGGENSFEIRLSTSGIKDLSSINSMSANGEEVTQLLVNGVVVWGDGSASYTNLILSATTEPFGTEIYNNIGYADGSRWSSSSKAIVSGGSTARVSGWMPFTAGATCRIKGFSVLTSGYVANFYVVGYKSDGTKTTHTYNKTSANWPFTYDEANDIATFTLPSAAYEYFLISAYIGSVAPIVTINEEIV